MFSTQSIRVLNRGVYMNLNNRKLTVLSLIAKSYLKTGEPVGSKALVAQLGGSVSSATIRNDMAELERQGLLYQPHTSAGRIPSAQGLLLYVEKLMQKRRLTQEKREFIDSIFSNAGSAQSAISAASDALADYSGCASFSLSPSGEGVTLKQIDFIKTGSQTMVFVLLTNTNVVKSVFVRLFGEVTREAIDALSACAQKNLCGICLSEITPPLLQTMAAELSQYALMLSPFFEELSKAVRELSAPGLYIRGQDNLLRDISSHGSAAKAINMLSPNQLLGFITPNSGLSVIIPNRDDDLSGALIYSGFKFSDNLMGSIGILGPYRIDYGSIIPMIEYFSSSLENMLKQEFDK